MSVYLLGIIPQYMDEMDILLPLGSSNVFKLKVACKVVFSKSRVEKIGICSVFSVCRNHLELSRESSHVWDLTPAIMNSCLSLT